MEACPDPIFHRLAPDLLHHHAPYRLAPERKLRLPRPIRLDLELLLLTHHPEEPLVRLMACGEAVGGRQSERHLGGSHVRVGVLAADGEAWISYTLNEAEAGAEVPREYAQAGKLWVMSVEDAAIALLPVRHVINSFVWRLLLFRSRTRRV